MKIIEIEALPNGGHRNQEEINYIPEGYAQIPDDMLIPSTFPFVNIEVGEETRYTEKRVYNEAIGEYDVERVPYTVKVVTSMTAGVVPPEPAPEEPENNELTAEQMAAAIMEGVNSI